MAARKLSVLPIVARLDEVQAIADLSVERITDEITAIVGVEDTPPLEAGLGICEDINFGDSTAQRAMARVAATLCRSLAALIGEAQDSIGRLLEGASAGINNVLDEVRDLVSGFTDTIVETLERVVDTIAATLEASLRSILNAAETVVSSIADFIEAVVTRIGRGVSAVLESIAGVVATVIRSIDRAIDELVSTTTRLLGQIVLTVRNVGEFLVELARATLDQMALSVAAVLGPLVGAGESVLGRLADIVESVPGALKAAGGAVTEGIGKFVGDPLGALGNIFVTQVEEFFEDLIEKGQLSHGEILRTLLVRLGAPPDAIEDIAAAADEATPTTAGFTVMALAFLIPLIIAQFVGAAMEPLAEQTRQKISSSITQTLISPIDLLDGLFKGDIPEQRFREDFEQAGYTEERVTQLIATFRHAPDVSVRIQAWLRGLIEESELDEALAANRMRGNDAALLKQVVFFIPPAQDLIRMAVREVFSPDVRERFGQDEDFPAEFATFARQQGISDEWARNYWAAHWALPSPAQGFEMLHRGVIDVEDLNVLLRALDVMPFWRDKLTAIAFNPLTRVDLRRMHALGLLTDKDLQTRYEAIGFGADDASLMVAFTVAFNASGDTLPDELEGLTRASVLNLFEDGLVTRDDAVTLLTGMGIGSDAAELFVDQREMALSRGERKDLIEAVVRLAGGGVISLPDAEDQLAQIGITAVEITRAIGKILFQRDQRDRLPSLADLTKMRNTEIIDDDVFLDALKASGFDDTWAAREFQLITGETVT